MSNVLIVEDEEDIIELMAYNLSKEGFVVDSLLDGTDILTKVKSKKPSLIILDLMLPGLDGLEICKMLKKDSQTERIPVIIVTAKTDESDIVTGLELGAEDYITKPFSPKILIARVRNVLRREANPKVGFDKDIRVHNLVISQERRDVVLDGLKLTLTYSEFQTLALLASQPGRVYTRYQIVEKVHGDDYAVTDRSIDVLIVSIRKKMGKYADYIETIRGVGYRFKDKLE